MNIDFISLFPDSLLAGLRHGVVAKAEKAGHVTFGALDPRTLTEDPHHKVDDTPCGGGPGMVMMAPVIAAALKALDPSPGTPVILLDPAAPLFVQADARKFAVHERLVFICGHYEGIDERVRERLCTHAYSVGDFVLSGGELAAAAIANAVVRLLPGVLGDPESHLDDSFENGLLGFPLYTRPVNFEGSEVPETLLSGDHKAIARWRRAQSLKRTRQFRPDLFARADLTAGDLDLL